LKGEAADGQREQSGDFGVVVKFHGSALPDVSASVLLSFPASIRHDLGRSGIRRIRPRGPISRSSEVLRLRL